MRFKDKETYTREQVLKIIKNIFDHILNHRQPLLNEFTLEDFYFVTHDDIVRLKEYWIKKYTA